MFMEKKISIIVPVYNVEDYIEDCLYSLLNQTFKNIEIILINDGSTDSSGEICDKFARNYSNIKVVHKENGGLSDARNKGLDIATGDYIGFVDSDDIISQNMYETLYNLCNKYNADVVSCGIYTFREDKFNLCNDTNENISLERCYYNEDIIKANYRGEFSSVSSCNKLYRKELFGNIRFPKGRVYEDVSTTYKIYLKSNLVVETDDQLYFYRNRDGSITHRKFSEKRFDIVPMYKEQYENMNDKFPDIGMIIKNDYYVNLKCIFVDVINDESIECRKGHIARCSELMKSELRYFLKNNLINHKDKLIALLISYFPYVIKNLYKIKIEE